MNKKLHISLMFHDLLVFKSFSTHITMRIFITEVFNVSKPTSWFYQA